MNKITPKKTDKMKAMFIELTDKRGVKFIGNINLLQSIFKSTEGGSLVVGWNNNGGINVKESFDDICKMLPVEIIKNDKNR